MPTAYIYFGKPINSDTVTSLVHACRTFMSEMDPQGQLLWDHIHVEMASNGGDMVSAFAAYNMLKHMPIRVTTHNLGAVDSAAIMPFLAGERRTASPRSAFFFHESQWTFAAQGALTATTIGDATKWLGTYESMMGAEIAANSKLSEKEVREICQIGTSVTAEQALEMNLIHAVETPRLPVGARSWTV